jgi:hypothetical protein
MKNETDMMGVGYYIKRNAKGAGRPSTGGRDHILKVNEKPRIDLVVELAKRYEQLLTSGDVDGLIALSAEYEKHGAIFTAMQIRKEAEAL